MNQSNKSRPLRFLVRSFQVMRELLKPSMSLIYISRQTLLNA